MTLPNFLVIGAGRAGTTSLHHYLTQHSEVYLPAVKSPSHFFCVGLDRIEDPYLRWVTRNYFVPDLHDYEKLFDGARMEKAIGEVSPVYLATVHAAPRIAARLPGVRLVALLRNPVDRVYARFVGRRRDGLERRPDFRRIVEEERTQPLIREVAFGTYLSAGFCGHFLQTYFDHFPREQIRVHLFEDFQRDPKAVMSDLFGFLGVDPDFVPDTATRHNRSAGLIHNPVARWIWTRSALPRVAVRPYLPSSLRDAVFWAFTRRLDAIPMDPALREELRELYREDVEKLQNLIGRDLSSWIAPG